MWGHRAPISAVTARAIRVSVSSGRWGPCCSSEPIGIASTDEAPVASTSRQGEAVRSTGSAGGGGTAAWGGDSGAGTSPGRRPESHPYRLGHGYRHAVLPDLRVADQRLRPSARVERRQGRFTVAVHAFGVGSVEWQP